MANKILVAANATPVVWAGVTYSGDGGSQTHLFILTSLALNAARQGEKADMDGGIVANRFPKQFAVTMRIEYGNGDPGIAGTFVDLYWAASPAPVDETANPGGCTGVDGSYTGTDGSTLDESLEQLQFIGRLHCTDDEIVQQMTFMATLLFQYGMPVVVNRGEPFIEDDNEMSITFTPYEYEVQ